MSIFSRKEKGTASAYDRFYAYDEKPKTKVLRDFSGGVSTKAFSDHTVSGMMNMDAEKGAVISHSLPKTEHFPGGFAEGNILYHCYADGIWLFRKGRTLYARKNETFYLVGTENMLEKEHGGIFRIGNLFYVIDGAVVIAVDREFSYYEVEQRVPVCFTDVSRDGHKYTECEKPNPFCPYIDLILGSDLYTYQRIPEKFVFDTSYVQVFSNDTGEEIPASNYTFDGEGVNCQFDPSGKRLRIKLLMSDDARKYSFSVMDDLREMFATPNPYLTFTMASGKSYFLTHGGEDNREILLFERNTETFSSLLESKITHFAEDESITAIAAYSDGFLLFTESVVKKISFSEDENGKITMKSEIFKYDFGSDMAGSVCGFDDKILFASSRGGIFYINKFGISERDASRKISANIEDGELGFFSHTEEEYRAARGICAFGKYFLTVGKVTYIWDYSAKLPSGTASRADEETMVWSLADRYTNGTFLQGIMGRLYLWDGEELGYLENQHSEDEPIPVSFQTAPFDFDSPEKKILTEIGIRYKAHAPLSVKLLFDGAETAAVYTLPKCENFATAWLHPYAKQFEKISVALSSDASFGAEAIIFKYI